MGFFKSSKGSIISDYFLLLEDIGQLKKSNMVDIALHEYKLVLSAPMSPVPVELKYDQITDVYYGPETEIIEKNKSVIGRAVVGGVLFGGAGAIVGAVSASGKKEKKVTKMKFIISYTSKTGEDAFLLFEDSRLYKGHKLSKKLKELCGIKDEVVTSL